MAGRPVQEVRWGQDVRAGGRQAVMQEAARAAPLEPCQPIHPATQRRTNARPGTRRTCSPASAPPYAAPARPCPPAPGRTLLVGLLVLLHRQLHPAQQVLHRLLGLLGPSPLVLPLLLAGAARAGARWGAEQGAGARWGAGPAHRSSQSRALSKQSRGWQGHPGVVVHCLPAGGFAHLKMRSSSSSSSPASSASSKPASCGRGGPNQQNCTS